MRQGKVNKQFVYKALKYSEGKIILPARKFGFGK